MNQLRPFSSVVAILYVIALVLAGMSFSPVVRADFTSAAPGACSNTLNSPIQNFCEATRDTLWRGAKPDVQGAAWLIGKGVRTIVNLELLNDDRATLASVDFNAQADDRDTLLHTLLPEPDTHDIRYYRVRDWEPLVVVAPWLTDDHVAQFLAVALQAPKPLYVHCRSGQNRTGVMVAAYRVIVEGQDQAAAIASVVAEMQAYRGIWFDSDAAYIRSLTPARRAEIREKINAWMPRIKPDALIRCEQGKCRIAE